MAEETGNQTTVETTETVEQSTTEATEQQTAQTSETTETTEATETDTTTESETETTATNPFSTEDLDWGDLAINDADKTATVEKLNAWVKGKDQANEVLKFLSDANKQNKESQAKKIADLEAGWEKSLKTDADFGKDYEGNKKRVGDLLKKFSSEEDMAEFDKFGYTKFPAFNRMVLRFAKEIEDAKIVGKGQPEAGNKGGLPVDRWGNTMFDFSKKQ